MISGLTLRSYLDCLQYVAPIAKSSNPSLAFCMVFYVLVIARRCHRHPLLLPTAAERLI